MALTKTTPTGINFLTREDSEADGINFVNQLHAYDKQAGSQGAGNTVFTLPFPYGPGTNTLIVFVNGQKAESVVSANTALEYEETNPLVVTFGASLLSADIVEFMVFGNYEVQGPLFDPTELFMPVGFIFPIVHSNSPPSGTLECNGSLISKTTYADLYSGYPLSIGTKYGDGGSTFRVPDLRGHFLRHVDGTRGIDPDKNSRFGYLGSPAGNQVGSYQVDEFESHRHFPQGGYANFFSSSGNTHGDPGDNYGTFAATGYTGGSTETRPRNFYVKWVIKY